MFKYLTSKLREYIFIILTATIFLTISFSKSIAEENVFIIDNVVIEGPINVNFSRAKYINKAFVDSFKILREKILLSQDINKLNNIKLEEIKTLINGFQVLEEKFHGDKYKGVFKIFYNDIKIKKLLGKKNISFSQPENITAVFFPVLIVGNETVDFNDNFFYKNWLKIKIENEIINFVLPIEDIDDISKVKKMKNNIQELEVGDLVNKYDIKNYVFLLMEYEEKSLNTHIKTNFNNSKMSKNISYKINKITDKLILTSTLKDLKTQITDIWKKQNIIDVSMPLRIRIKFKYKNIIDLDKLKNTFYKISIIDKFTLEELNINHAFFKIYYYGNPRKLKSELIKFNYQLKDDKGLWEIYLND